MTYFPHICIYFALGNLAGRTVRIIKEPNLSTSTLVIFFSSIGLCLSLAAVSFAYAHTSFDDIKNKIINAGEHFFAASILFITALLLAWVPSWIQDLHATYEFIKPVDKLLSSIVVVSVSLSSFNSACAVMVLSKAIFVLQGILDRKTFPYWSFTRKEDSEQKKVNVTSLP